MSKDKESIKKELIQREIEAKQYLNKKGYKPSDYYRLPRWLLHRLRFLSDKI